MEESDLTNEALKLLGERVPQKTGRLMSCTACSVVSGEAHLADEEELAAYGVPHRGSRPY
ncbi:hypothetical protein [Streptomyces noursei]|uniref:hypothetical protein n=1 Tax=Streptomyces noursei TaxID=1971 RepID=UPI002E165EA8